MNSLAYDLSLFDGSRAERPALKIVEKETKKLRRAGRIFCGFLVTLICVVGIGTTFFYMYCRSEETKWQFKLNSIQTELDEQVSYNKTLYFQVMCARNQEKLSEYIEDHNLVKYDQAQTQYIYYDKDDVVVVN